MLGVFVDPTRWLLESGVERASSLGGSTPPIFNLEHRDATVSVRDSFQNLNES
jgi:hypothetical protein